MLDTKKERKTDLMKGLRHLPEAVHVILVNKPKVAFTSEPVKLKKTNKCSLYLHLYEHHCLLKSAWKKM